MLLSPLNNNDNRTSSQEHVHQIKNILPTEIILIINNNNNEIIIPTNEYN